MWPVLGFGVFAAIVAVGAWRSLRMSEDELETFLRESRSRSSFLGLANRAPVAWVVVSVLAVLSAAAVWILDETSAAPAKALAGVLFASWIASTAIAISVSVWGRPELLLHPHLRRRRRLDE
jgi:hypothetical protein